MQVFTGHGKVVLTMKMKGNKKAVAGGERFSNCKRNNLIIANICLSFILILETMLLICNTLGCGFTEDLICAVSIILIVAAVLITDKSKIGLNRVALGLIMILVVLIVYLKICFA